jgi:hypothetical protein
MLLENIEYFKVRNKVGNWYIGAFLFFTGTHNILIFYAYPDILRFCKLSWKNVFTVCFVITGGKGVEMSVGIFMWEGQKGSGLQPSKFGRRPYGDAFMAEKLEKDQVLSVLWQQQ